MNQEIETVNADDNADDNADVEITILTDEQLETIVGAGSRSLWSG